VFTGVEDTMTRARSTLSLIPLGGVVALGLSLAGCGMEPDLDLETADETAMVELQQSELTAVGCAAIVTDSRYDNHTGALIGYGTGLTEIVINQVRWRIRNPSNTDCNYVELTFTLRDGYGKLMKKSGVLTTSLKAGYRRDVYWNPHYDSRTLGPRPEFTYRWYIDAFLFRNGIEIRDQNIATFFLETGQS
jgi:hypothetical protein